MGLFQIGIKEGGDPTAETHLCEEGALALIYIKNDITTSLQVSSSS